MSEMIGRVAKAIQEILTPVEGQQDADHFDKAARAAILAMRDPTDDMADSVSYQDGEWSRRNIEAFVDTALK